MADIRNREGKLTFLRAHDVGTGYGPPNDELDVEAVFILDSAPTNAFGFQMRTDANEATREAMFSLLRDAFVHDLTVSADYFIEAGRNNGQAFRIALIRTSSPSPVRVDPVASAEA
jgi:hypothetical protein